MSEQEKPLSPFVQLFKNNYDEGSTEDAAASVPTSSNTSGEPREVAQPITPEDINTPSLLIGNELFSKRTRNAEEKVVARWDYPELTKSALDSLRSRAVEVRLLVKTAHAAAYHVGSILDEVQSKYDSTTFSSWMNTAAGLSRAQGYRYLSLYKTFDKGLEKLTSVPLNVLAKVASPKFSDESRVEIVQALLKEKDPKAQKAIIIDRIADLQAAGSTKGPSSDNHQDPLDAQRDEIAKLLDAINQLEELINGTTLDAVRSTLCDKLSEVRQILSNELTAVGFGGDGHGEG